MGWKVIAGLAALAAGTVPAAADTIEFFPVENAPAPRPFSDAVRVGEILYLSGEIGTLPDGSLAPGGLAGESRQVMENIGAKLKRRGLGFDDVFKCTVMIADMSKWGDFNAIYTPYFKPGRLPARSAFGANGLALGAQIELECWAKYPDGD